MARPRKPKKKETDDLPPDDKPRPTGFLILGKKEKAGGRSRKGKG